MPALFSSSDRLKLPAEKTLWRVITVLFAVAWGLLVWRVGQLASDLNLFDSSTKWQAVRVGTILFMGIWLVFTAAVCSHGYDVISSLTTRLFAWMKRIGILCGLISLALLVVLPYLFYGKYGYLFDDLGSHFALVMLVGLAAAVFLRAAFPEKLSWAGAWVLAPVLVMTAVRLAGFIADVNPSPLTIGWSEASRYYYASLFFSKSVYGVQLPLPFLHPSRYLMQSAPFLIPGLPLVIHRLWQVILWIGMSGLTAALLVRRLKVRGIFAVLGVATWIFLFLLQGPVYYHLLVSVCLILAGVDARKGWRSFVIILIASAWAGISRINWFPVPAMLAIAIYLIETPQSRARSLWRYLTQPALWAAAGVAVAYVAQQVYIRISGNDPSLFRSSFSSDLLWYRLFPSPTYPPGILPMTIAVALPLLVLLGWALLRLRLSWVRSLGLLGMLVVLLGGGVVVSVKIGGGSNLHNMDAFLVLLLVCATWVAFGHAAPEQREAKPVRIHWALIALAAVLPFYPLLREVHPFAQVNQLLSKDDAKEVSVRVQQVEAQGGKVLFIWQKQLVTYGQASDPNLESRYETVDLMEMAMANNPAYMNGFYDDLKNHRFALIVSGVQNLIHKDADSTFPEENNVWVERVSAPLLQYYSSSKVLPYSGIQLLTPK